MNEEAINTFINKYISEHLSPKPEHRTYISKKYEAICNLLGGTCFQAGSYARYTAIYPVHDLDIIYVVSDRSIKTDPLRFMEALRLKMEKSGIAGIEKVYMQSHSVTIVFNDSDGDTEFTIDIVPALELPERNHPYGDPIYEVPEILKLNKRNRKRRYEQASEEHPIIWVKTDPRGYITAASDLNDKNRNFRHATKFGKGWRHACKDEYEDGYCLKSFHLEQIFFRYFTDNPGATTLGAITHCLGWIPTALTQPQFKDRADESVFIDEYVRSLTPTEKALIIRLQAEAQQLILRLPGAANEAELEKLLDAILDVKKPRYSFPAATVVAQPRQPWAC